MAMARGSARKNTWLTVGSLIGLSAGFLAGAWAHRTDAAWLLSVSEALNPFGTIWVNAVRMTVTPLVVAQIVTALVGTGRVRPVGRIAALSFSLFTAMLVVGAVVTVTAMPAIMTSINFSPGAIENFRAALPAETALKSGTPPGFAQWVIGLIPTNPFRAAAQDDLLGLMVFAAAFALAVTRLSAERQALVGELADIVRQGMLTIIGWIMWALPFAVFVLSMASAAKGGSGALEVLAIFVILNCVLLLAWTLLMYPLAATLGGVSIGRFARAALPVQIIAVSTRSSLASLPSLIENARTKLGLRDDVVSLVMPLAVSTFKTNRTITGPFIFLAYVSGVPLSASDIIAFAAATILLSYSSVGIPSGGSEMRTLPLFVAAGIPVQAYVLTEAVDTIPDIFKTLLNVTGDMTAAAIVSRYCTSREPVPATLDDTAVEGAASGA
jgi:proton glutamate symport protein